MANDAKQSYKLYALPLTTENILAAANERFSRATPTPEPGYVLIYSEGQKPEGSTEITAEHENGTFRNVGKMRYRTENVLKRC